jgi:exodeoxyribonuclease VII small subunit
MRLASKNRHALWAEEAIMAAKKAGSVGQPSFEESLVALEQLVEQLESGELGLEASLKEFEKGVTYYKACREQLARAEKKLSELTEQLKEEKLDIE